MSAPQFIVVERVTFVPGLGGSSTSVDRHLVNTAMIESIEVLQRVEGDSIYAAGARSVIHLRNRNVCCLETLQQLLALLDAKSIGQ